VKYPRYSSGLLATAATISLAMSLLVACNQSKPSAPAPAARAGELTSTVTVFIQFEGPWAFAPDPNDANQVIAIAPKTAGHQDLYVKASNEQTLASGIYNLSLPIAGPGPGTLDPGIAQAPISTASLQHALGASNVRYALRLPKPDAYVAAGRSESRVADTYPPAPATQDNHITAVSLRYTVSSTTGFTLAGTPDAGTFNPLLLQVETPLVRVVIEPSQMDDPLNLCETHSRESFRDLVRLLGITLYVDFPGYTAACQSHDPQLAANATPPWLDRVQAALSADLLDGSAEGASMANDGAASAAMEFFSRSIRRPLLAAFHFFAHPGANCKAAILVLHF
jgi:hypothetical protein